MKPSFRECMAAELRPVVQKHLGQPVQRVRLRLSTRGDFGDVKLKPQKAFGKMFVRMVIVFPVGAVATVLCLSVIGLPLGLILFAWIGSWCSKPVTKHPVFNAETAYATSGRSTVVDKYEEAYNEYEYGYNGREWK